MSRSKIYLRYGNEPGISLWNKVEKSADKLCTPSPCAVSKIPNSGFVGFITENHSFKSSKLKLKPIKIEGKKIKKAIRNMVKTSDL